MSNRTFIYIDGESHFHRTEDAWRKLHGSDVTLENIRFRNDHDDKLMLVNRKTRIFWTRRMNPGVIRAYYYSTISGDDMLLHEAKSRLRVMNLEPEITIEFKQLETRRNQARETLALIEKPKGVDIALAVRMIEDAEDHFDTCHLYTSDIDFLPVIKSVRTKVKKVIVHGFPEGLSERSPFLTDCDAFIDLTEMLKTEFVPGEMHNEH